TRRKKWNGYEPNTSIRIKSNVQDKYYKYNYPNYSQKEKQIVAREKVLSEAVEE
ncbi:10669_t:CDS:1, partial [Racocetra persica]